jgi:hypothetical protein
MLWFFGKQSERGMLKGNGEWCSRSTRESVGLAGEYKREEEEGAFRRPRWCGGSLFSAK